MIRDLLEEKGLKFGDCQQVELIVLVDDGLKVADLGQAFQYDSHLVASEATIVEKDAVHLAMVDELAGFG